MSFLSSEVRQVETCSLSLDLLTAAAMVAGIVSWGGLFALLAG